MSAKNLSNAGVLFDERRDVHIQPNIVAELYPSVTPFTTLLLSKPTRKVNDPLFKLFEHRSGFLKQQFVGSAFTGTMNAVGTTTEVTVTGIEGLPQILDESIKGFVVEIRNGSTGALKQIAFVKSVTSGKPTLQSLGNPEGAIVAPAANDVCYVITNAHGEGTEAPEANYDELSVVWGSTQIFKTSVEVVGTLYETALRGYSKELERLRQEKLKEHKFQIEKALLLGYNPNGTNHNGGDTFANSENIVDAEGKTVRLTTGIVPLLRKYGYSSGDKKNLFTIDSSSYSFSNYVDDTEKVFQYVPDNGYKTAFCGSSALSYWSKMDASNGFVKKSGWTVNLSKSEMTGLGYAVRSIETPHGTLEFVYTPELRDYYKNNMVIIDDSKLELVEFRPFKFKANIKTDNGYDGYKDEYFYDGGLGLTLIETHSLWTIA